MADLINQETGQYDPESIHEATDLRACREFGSPNYPLCEYRDARQWVMARAELERTRWHRLRGLTPPGWEPENLTTITPFGRARRGVRFSEF